MCLVVQMLTTLQGKARKVILPQQNSLATFLSIHILTSPRGKEAAFIRAAVGGKPAEKNISLAHKHTHTFCLC